MTAPRCSRSHHRIRLRYPSGLLVLDTDSSVSGSSTLHICLLQHNSVSLKPSFQRVKELRGVISSKECESIIRDANSYADINGWTSSRHTSYSTTDIPVDLLYGEDNHIDEIVKSIVLPELATFYDLERDALHILELFVVKYESNGEGSQCSLMPHVDGAPWSFVTALNDSSEYDGGGTHFISSDHTYKSVRAGGTVIFSGKNWHEGLPVTRGTRYILTGFCDYVPTPPLDSTPHKAFLRLYNSLYDGYAGQDGIQTGDVITGVYDSDNNLHCIGAERTIHDLLQRVASNSSGSETSIMVERLIDVPVDDDEDDSDGNGDEGDDRVIREVILNVDQFLSVGQFWRFDES